MVRTLTLDRIDRNEQIAILRAICFSTVFSGRPGF